MHEGGQVSETVSRTYAGERGPRPARPSRATLWAGAAAAIAAAAIAWAAYSHRGVGPAAPAPGMPLAQVTVSRPLARALDKQLGFLGQFSAVDRVELRAQVGGTLTGIYFKDGDIVRQGELLFTVDTVPYDIKLAEAEAQLQTATARLALADRQLYRAQALKRTDYGTAESVDQRTSDERAAQASVDAAKAQLRDAQFDVAHCRVTAPLTGRIGAHLVSIGNLIAGSRTASSPTTLLATLVSLDPIHLDFDISEADFLTFSRYRAQLDGSVDGSFDDRVELALSDERRFARRGRLDFVNNALDRSSGTIHARATVANPDLFLTPGEFARVRVVVAPPAPILLVPDGAVLPDQSRHIVMTVSPEAVVVPKEVEIGDIRGGLRVIRSGLAASDRVIIDGLPYATPGSKVTAQEGAIVYAAAGGQ